MKRNEKCWGKGTVIKDPTCVKFPGLIDSETTGRCSKGTTDGIEKDTIITDPTSAVVAG